MQLIFFRCDDARAKFKRGSVIFKLEKNLIIEPRLVGATVTKVAESFDSKGTVSDRATEKIPNVDPHRLEGH